jgi:hypothetical protein
MIKIYLKIHNYPIIQYRGSMCSVHDLKFVLKIKHSPALQMKDACLFAGYHNALGLFLPPN